MISSVFSLTMTFFATCVSYDGVGRSFNGFYPKRVQVKGLAIEFGQLKHTFPSRPGLDQPSGLEARPLDTIYAD
jgi:hypothetical protein